jgi:ribonuclease P protein component
MIRTIVHREDFERLLATRPSSRSAHFAVHHLSRRPSEPKSGTGEAARDDLSTAHDEHVERAVENSPRLVWLGVMVPKRQARRAVTRNLMKRQVRSVFAAHEARLASGLWLVRLRQGFAKAEFLSAASPQLRCAVRRELEGLLRRGTP